MNQLKKALLFIAVLALLPFSLAACGGDDGDDGGGGGGASAPSSAPPEESSGAASQDAATTVDGSWTGTYESEAFPGNNGGFEFQLKQSGTKFSGPFTLNTAGACISSAEISGTVTGSEIDFGAVEGGQKITYTGTVKGDEMSGTYSAPAACDNDEGTWKATRSG